MVMMIKQLNKMQDELSLFIYQSNLLHLKKHVPNKKLSEKIDTISFASFKREKLKINLFLEYSEKTFILRRYINHVIFRLVKN